MKSYSKKKYTQRYYINSNAVLFFFYITTPFFRVIVRKITADSWPLDCMRRSRDHNS